MVLLITTPAILDALSQVPESQRDNLQLPSPASLSIDGPISHSQLITLASYFVASQSSSSLSPSSSDHTLNELLRGTKVYIPPPPPKPQPTKEYLALKASLQQRAEQDAYNRLLSSSPSYNYNKNSFLASKSAYLGISGGIADDDENGDDDPLTPSIVINIFLSILLTGFSSYWALRNFRTPDFLTLSKKSNKTKEQPSYPGNPPPSKDAVFVLISITIGIIVGVAEVVVYTSYLRKVREAKRKEKSLKERKAFVRTVHLSGFSDDGDDDHRAGVKGEEDDHEMVRESLGRDDPKKEEIWGRGINGGMRRRVKERWGRGNEKENDTDQGDS